MRHLIAAAAIVLLVACSSLNIDTMGKLRALDYVNDDVASLLIAFDLPRGVDPVEDGSMLTFDVTAKGGGSRHLEAILARADADDVAGRLPPPAAQRLYFLFGFSEPDKASLRAIQAWAKALAPGSGTVSVSLAPRFCSTAPIDPQTAEITVLVALPGTETLAPLIDRQKLSATLAPSGGSLPACS